MFSKPKPVTADEEKKLEKKDEKSEVATNQVAAVQLKNLDLETNWNRNDGKSTIIYLDDNDNIGTRPIWNGTANEKKCKILFDFGSEITLVSPNLIAKDAETVPCYAQILSPLHPDRVQTFTRYTNLI